MHKMLMIGMMLLIAACNPVTIKKPITGTFVNFDLGTTIDGPVNFDYQTNDRELIGKWSSDTAVTYGTTDALNGTYFCISAESFFTTVVPTLKKGHDDYYNWKNRNDTP